MHAFLGLSLADLGLIFAIAVLDGLLSIDNALVNAAQAQRLPRNQQRQAIILGLALGALFRVAALAFASWIIHFPLLKLFGAVWLFWLVTKHFVFKSEGEDDQPKQAHDALFRVIVAIGVTDMAFSIDNVVAAVAMSPSFIIGLRFIFGA